VDINWQSFLTSRLITTIGPYAWLIGGEYPNNQHRGYVFGIASALNFLLTWCGTFTAPYFINPASLNWNAQYGYIWFVSNMIMVVFAFFFLPETRDRTLEEIHEMFEAKLPARQFKGHVCAGVQSMAAAAFGKDLGKEEHEIIELEVDVPAPGNKPQENGRSSPA